MQSTEQLRALLARQLDWEDAHVAYERAVADFPPQLRGVTPEGLDHSAWHLIEHMRITQRDILDFCVNPDYAELPWPDGYWPENAAPADDAEWGTSIEEFARDLDALRALALDGAVDLFASIPWGSGQTYLRELLLVVDHNAYELGQLVIVRRLLGCWPSCETSPPGDLA